MLTLSVFKGMDEILSETVPILVPDWPLPASVRSVITTRCKSSCKESPVAGEILGANSAAQGEQVQAARALLSRQLNLRLPPQWLIQEHGNAVVEASIIGTPKVADASYTDRPGLACAVLSADCLPLLISAKDGSLVAAAHGGWRGLASGIIAATLTAMNTDPAQLSVYLGPAICAQHFEVGPEVRQAFLTGWMASNDQVQVAACFRPSKRTPGHYFADLYQLARIQLTQLGVRAIYGGEYCTYAQDSLFYSYRRQHDSGRMASLIWIAES